MAVSKEGKRWLSRTPVGAGKYHKRLHPKKSDAEEYERDILAQVRAGTYGTDKKDPGTVAEFCWTWFGNQPDSVNYRLNVSSHLRNHIIPEFGDLVFSTITDSDVQRFINKLSKTLVATSVVTVLCTWKMICKAAVKRQVIAFTPCEDLKMPKVEHKEIVVLRTAHVQAIAEQIFPRYRALVLFTAATGMRQGEVFGIRITDICWDRGRGVVRVQRQIQSYTGGAQQVQPTKNSAHRTIPIPDEVLVLLEKHLADYPANAEGYVFTNGEGRPLHRRPFDRAFDAARRRAAAQFRAEMEERDYDSPIKLALDEGEAQQIETAKFHGLRHFYASLLIRRGLNVKVVSARLGHANVAMTLKIYSHLWDDDNDRTREAITGLVPA